METRYGSDRDYAAATATGVLASANCRVSRDLPRDLGANEDETLIRANSQAHESVG